MSDTNVESGRDDTTLVESTNKIDNNLASTVIVNDLKLSNVAVLHHHGQESDHHLGAGSQNNLTFTGLLKMVRMQSLADALK